MKKRKKLSQQKKKTLVADLGKSIDQTVVLLLDLKNSPGIIQGMKDDINKRVECLQRTRRQLSDLERSDFSEVVFEPIKKLWNIWRKVRGC